MNGRAEDGKQPLIFLDLDVFISRPWKTRAKLRSHTSACWSETNHNIPND